MKSICSKQWSAFTDTDFTDIEAKIKQAQADYQKYLDEYNWGMQYGSSSYAKRVRWPRVAKAQQVLNDLQTQYEDMLSATNKTQAINIVDTTVSQATAPPTNTVDWKTIGLAVGALVVVVIIIKLI